jgi:hypothetical protein
LPPVTVADRVAAALVLTATAFLAWSLACQGHAGAAWVVGLAGFAGGVAMILVQNHSRGRPRVWLEISADGGLYLRRDGQAPVSARLGRGTRLLGPSVFLDLGLANRGNRERLLRWITRHDVPAEALRRWTVILPRSGCKDLA